jgi:hypothetical protein
MENKYTITLYYYNRSSNGIYTKTQLLKEAGKITGRESFTDVEAAKEVVAKDLNTPSWDVQELELHLTMDDYSGNIRPDGHFAAELDLGIFALNVGRDSNVVKNFSSFERDDKIIICNFIEKAQALYKYETDEYDELIMTLRGRMRAIVSEFVRDTFHTEPSQTPGHKIMLMEKFNGLELDELKRILLDVLNKASIKELVENGDDLNAKLARDFSCKIVASQE